MRMHTRTLAAAAVVGAAYAALTLLLAPVSFGPVQLRVAEALCVLPVFMPAAAWGLWAGCALANLLGGYGLPDVVFGSLATLLAGLTIARLGRGRAGALSWGRCLLVCLAPAAWNGPVVGAVIAYGSGLPWGWGWALVMGQLALEEAAVLLLLGLPLLRLLPKNAALLALLRPEGAGPQNLQ